MRIRLLGLVFVLLIAGLGVLAWQRNTRPEAPLADPSTMPGAAVEAPATEPPPALGGTPDEKPDPGLEWDAPPRWVAELPQGMRLASYIIPPEDKADEPARCAVYYFGPGQGGTVDANIERWTNELDHPSTPVRRNRTVHGMSITEVQVSGIYTAHASGPGEAEAAKVDWTLRGAIVDGPLGAVFFKLTGPAATVARAAPELDAMLGSLRKK